MNKDQKAYPDSTAFLSASEKYVVFTSATMLILDVEAEADLPWNANSKLIWKAST